MATTRWEQWRDDTPEQKTRNIARDLDDNDRRLDRHDRYHRDTEATHAETHRAESSRQEAWQEHVDQEIDGIKKILIGAIIAASGFIVVAGLNIAVLIAKG